MQGNWPSVKILWISQHLQQQELPVKALPTNVSTTASKIYMGELSVAPGSSCSAIVIWMLIRAGLPLVGVTGQGKLKI